MTFDNFPLHDHIKKAVAEAGYETPTKIQLKAIPKIVKGFDVRASAQTGTGKTAAFLLPALDRLATPSTKSGKGPRILVLTPTRELAMQIADQADKYSKYMNRTKTVCVVGGVPYFKQTKQLSKPCDILIATPGRLIDLLNQKKVKLSRVEMLILDEADRMLDMGFLPPVEEIVAATPSDRQTLLFSATLKGEVQKLSERLLTKPMDIVVHAEKEKHENIEQKLHFVNDMNHKNQILEHILDKKDLNHAIVFTSTKRHADRLTDELQDKGYEAAALHGDMNQRQRTRTLAQMKRGSVKILVATDVAARGIDVQSISHVINFDLPQTCEDYVHRIGRTGRAGAKGKAFTFAAKKDSGQVKRIERYTGQEIAISEIPGLEPSTQKSSNPKPKWKKRSFHQQKSKRPGGGGGSRRGGKANQSNRRTKRSHKSRP